MQQNAQITEGIKVIKTHCYNIGKSLKTNLGSKSHFCHLLPMKLRHTPIKNHKLSRVEMKTK